jgi:hypothetical protein
LDGSNPFESHAETAILLGNNGMTDFMGSIMPIDFVLSPTVVSSTIVLGHGLWHCHIFYQSTYFHQFTAHYRGNHTPLLVLHLGPLPSFINRDLWGIGPQGSFGAAS